jgi:hypothetical protein
MDRPKYSNRSRRSECGISILSYRQEPRFVLWGHWLRICPEGFSAFPQYLQTTTGGSALKLGHTRFLLHPFQFIIHCHPIIPVASATDSVVNIPKLNQLFPFMFVFLFLSFPPPPPRSFPYVSIHFGLLLSPHPHFPLLSSSATAPPPHEHEVCALKLNIAPAYRATRAYGGRGDNPEIIALNQNSDALMSFTVRVGASGKFSERTALRLSISRLSATGQNLTSEPPYTPVRYTNRSGLLLQDRKQDDLPADFQSKYSAYVLPEQ